MYQLTTGQKTAKFNISAILLTRDVDFERCLFLFYQSHSVWYQIYCDENVMFIVMLNDDLGGVLSDLNQIKMTEFLFDDDFLLEYQNNKLTFMGDKYFVNFNITDNQFFVSDFITTQNQ